MAFPNTILIADIKGPGVYDTLDQWSKAVPACLQGTKGISRVGRYRKLNDLRMLIVAEAEDPSLLDALKQAVSSLPAPFAAAFVVGTQMGQRQRPDAPADVREVPILYTVTFPIPPEREGELGDWYDQEHMPMLQESEYWPATRRFRVEDGAPALWGRHLALHYLSDLQALRSVAREKARKTPWRSRLASESWYPGTYDVYLQEL